MLQFLITQGVAQVYEAKIDLELLRFAAQKWIARFDSQSGKGGGQAELARMLGVDDTSIGRFIEGGGMRQRQARRLVYRLGLSPVPEEDLLVPIAETLEGILKQVRAVHVPAPIRTRQFGRQLKAILEGFPEFREFVEKATDWIDSEGNDSAHDHDTP